MDPFYYDDTQSFFNQYPQYDYYPFYGQMNQGFRRRNISLGQTIEIASKTIGTINQIIPFIYQITPVIINLKNAFRIIQSVNVMNDIDDQEIDDAIIVEKEKDNVKETVENVV